MASKWKPKRRRKRNVPLALPAAAAYGFKQMSGIGAQHYTVSRRNTPATVKALRDLTRELSREHGLRVRSPRSGMGGYFIPSKKTVVFRPKNVDIGLHELGHATMLRKSTFGAVRRAVLPTGFHLFRNKGAIGALGAVSGDTTLAPTVVLAASAPILGEEAIANIQAARAIRKATGGGVKGFAEVGKYLARMAPAYGTYLGGAGLSAGLAYGLARIIRASQAKQKRKR
jgi:hypothetical protein